MSTEKELPSKLYRVNDSNGIDIQVVDPALFESEEEFQEALMYHHRRGFRGSASAARDAATESAFFAFGHSR